MNNSPSLCTPHHPGGMLCRLATAPALIALITLAAFAPTWNNLLMTAWDDQWQVTNRFTAGGFTADHLRAIFTEPYETQYSPLNQCLYTLLYTLGGYNPMIFHATCLAVHVANSMLVYRLLLRLMADGDRLSAPVRTQTAFLTTLLFAVHPLQVEAVAWVSASKILLCTLFYLLATMQFIRHLGGGGRRHYAGALLLFLCAYGCKEQALIFPVWATWLMLFYKRRPTDTAVWRTLAPFYLLSLVLGLVFVCIISPARGGDWLSLTQTGASPAPVPGYTWMQRLVFGCYSLVEYVTKWYVPFNLLYLYPFPMRPGEPLPAWLLTYPLIVTAGCAALWFTARHKAVRAGLAFFVIHLLPVLHVIPIGRAAIVADRYIYLASVGLSFVAVHFLVAWWHRQNRTLRGRAAACMALVVLALCVYTFRRTQVWHNSDTLRAKMTSLKQTPPLASPIPIYQP
ncbi:MAG: hypothetical protein NC388_03190 [Clostridium sp.]|nr:hypothetical protein [Clostridium sp.]